jgi:hypothetical protein
MSAELFSGVGSLTPDEQFGRIWPDQPDSWMSSEEEWIIYWYLKYKLKWVEDEDFYYQGRVYVDALFANRDFTQADFIIDTGPETKIGMIGNISALVLDPFTEFTHDRDLDFRRWQALAEEGYGLIFLASNDVKWRTAHVVAEALKGKDISNRGWGVVE